MRRPFALALAPCVVAAGAACSLLTPLATPRDGSTSTDAGPLCVPEVIADVGVDASVTSLYVDTVLGNAYFVSSPLGNVYAIAVDAGAGSTPSIAMSSLVQPRRIVGTQKSNATYLYVATTGTTTSPGGIFVLTPDAGVQALVDGSVVANGTTYGVHADGIAERGLFPPSLYWVSCAQTSCKTGQIFQTDVGSGTTTLLATMDGGPHDIILTDLGVPWWDTKTTGQLFTLGEAGAPGLSCGGVIAYAPAVGTLPPRIYYTTDATCGTSSAINSIDSDDPSATPASFDGSSLVDGISSMVFDRTKYLYWANTSTSTIARKPVDGSGPAEIVAASPGMPHQIAYASGTLYWTIDGGLVRCVLPT